MASPLYTAVDLYYAVNDSKWDEVRRIITSHPLLVNEIFYGDPLLYQIVTLYNAPRDVLVASLNSATREAVDYVDRPVLGRCILHHLARDGRSELLRVALNISKHNVNLKDIEGGNTPLHWLLRENHQFSDHLDIARFLLDSGADSTIQNKGNQTPGDVYMKNECSKYDSKNRKKHKKEVLQLLQGFEIPEAILARGSEALKVFNAELEEGRITVNHARLMVTGKEGVGKTCLVKTLLEKPFNEAEPSTDGIVLTTAFQTTDIGSEWKETENMDECERIKQIYDNALEGKVAEKLKQKGSQAEAAEPVPAYIQKSTHVPPLTHAPKKSNVFVRVFQRLTKKEGHRKPGTSSTPVLPSLPVPVETKVNDPSQALPSARQKRIIDRMMGKASQETVNEDMTYIWDFAGQQLYYITHRIFLTSEAVYLILFNLMEGMHDKGKCRVSKMAKGVMTYNMTNIQIIKYWMRLIFTYAVPVESQLQAQLQAKKPQIVVVGTHAESLQGSAEDQRKQIEEQFGIIFEEIEGTPYECHVVRKMYAIDNKFPTQSEMLTTLKQDVGGFLKAMPKTIPLKWLEFQRILQENGRTAVRMSYAKVCEVATNCGISVKNLIHTLNYLHDLGIILYFENNKLLKDTVITNPRKLIDIFKKIITVVEPDDIDKWASMIKLWSKLDNEGILEEELVRHLWRDELSKDETSFEVFLELMKQFGLLCEQKNVESTQRSFFVPSRLKRSKESLSIEPDTDQMVSIYMASEDFIPDSIFHPLVVSLIGMVQDMDYTAKLELFSNNATIALGRDHILSIGPVVIDNKPSLKLEVLHKPIDQEGDTNMAACEPSPRVCMQVLEFLKQEMKLLTSGMKHTGYTFRVLCWKDFEQKDSQQTSQQMHFHDLEECLTDNYIPCGKRFIKTSKLKRMFKNSKQETAPTPSDTETAPPDTPKQAPTPSDIETVAPDKDLGYLEDKHLVPIANGMGLEWKQLGVRLGLGWRRIQQIWSDHRLTSYCTLNMLTEWKKRQNYDTNLVKIMDITLREQGLTELANTVFGLQTSDDQSADRGNGCGKLQQTQQEHDGCLKDIDMLFVSEIIGTDWKELGNCLHMGKREINRIAADFSPPTVDACIEMLVQWRERQEAEVNHLETISDALDKLERIDIKEELVSYYQKKYH